jgi:exosome complex RNA-binding protein Csl4
MCSLELLTLNFRLFRKKIDVTILRENLGHDQVFDWFQPGDIVRACLFFTTNECMLNIGKCHLGVIVENL